MPAASNREPEPQPASAPPSPIGLIAGQGRLPVLTAQGIHAAGRQVMCVGLRDQFDAELIEHCDRFKVAGIIQLGKWIRTLRRWGVREAVMVGRVRKSRIFAPFRVLRQLPDWRAARVWYRRLRHDRRSEALLKAVADELAEAGIALIDSTTYIPQHLATLGVMTRHKPAAAQQADIDFALPLIRQLCALHIGQAMIVKDREVIAVEAIEGTDAMIRRAAEHCRPGGWVLIKAAHPDKDMRFDVPTVGQRTLELMREHRGAVLAVEAERTILVDKPALLEAADAVGIPVVGVALT
jgi:DUF1009 family protein